MTFDIERLRTVRLGRLQVLQVVQMSLDDSIFITVLSLKYFIRSYVSYVTEMPSTKRVVSLLSTCGGRRVC